MFFNVRFFFLKKKSYNTYKENNKYGTVVSTADVERSADVNQVRKMIKIGLCFAQLKLLVFH